MNNKVYCINCIFYKFDYSVNFGDTYFRKKEDLCLHPLNIKKETTYINTYYTKLKKPNQLNEYNDCKLYYKVSFFKRIINKIVLYLNKK